MKIIIEVESGIVSGIYYQREATDPPFTPIPDVFVVDLDGAKVGESTAAQEHIALPLEDASDITIESARAI